MNLKFSPAFFTKHLQKVQRKFTSNDYMNPLRDWAIGLSAITMFLFLSISFVAYDFYSEFYLPQSEIEIQDTSIKYAEKEVLYYARVYDTQETEFAELRTKRPAVAPIPVPVPVPVETVPEPEPAAARTESTDPPVNNEESAGTTTVELAQ